MELVEITCFHCHALFGMTRAATDQLHRSHDSFYCPYCQGSQCFTGKTEADTLKEKLADVQQANTRSLEREAECRRRCGELERSRNALKGQVTKLTKKKEGA